MGLETTSESAQSSSGLKIRSVSFLAESGSSDIIKIASRILIQQAKSNRDESVETGAGRQKEGVVSMNKLVERLWNLNPCVCFHCCCYGNFSLRTGCYVVAGCLMGYGILSIISAIMLSEVNFVYFNDENCEPSTFRNFRLTRAYIFQHDRTLVLSLLVIRGLFFEITPAIVLVFAAKNLDYSFCFIYSVAVCTEILGSVIVMGLFTDYVLTENIPRVDTSFKKVFFAWLWAIFLLTLCFRFYCLACGISLYRQIRNGDLSSNQRVVPVIDE